MVVRQRCGARGLDEVEDAEVEEQVQRVDGCGRDVGEGRGVRGRRDGGRAGVEDGGEVHV